jgi:predicted nucleic acid-binding protein
LEEAEYFRDYRLKLPDAIIAATAFLLGAELLSNDERLASIPVVTTISLRLR